MRWSFAILMVTCFCPALAQQCPPAPSKLEVAKGEYFSRPGVVFILQNFYADMAPKAKTAPQCFIKTTRIEHGRVYVSTDSLTHLFQERIENSTSDGEQKNGGKAQDQKEGGKDKKNNKDQKDNGKDKDQDKNKEQGKNQKEAGKDEKGQLSDVTIKTKGNEIVISGKRKGAISIPFELSGPLDVVNGHVLRLQVKKIKAAGIESKGLLDMLGVHLTKMLHPDESKGVSVQENAILVDTEAIANVKGEIARAQISGNNLVVDFVPEGRATKKADAHPSPRKPTHAVAAATPIKK